jgi:hypothetical protein
VLDLVAEKFARALEHREPFVPQGRLCGHEANRLLSSRQGIRSVTRQETWKARIRGAGTRPAERQANSMRQHIRPCTTARFATPRT